MNKLLLVAMLVIGFSGQAQGMLFGDNLTVLQLHLQMEQEGFKFIGEEEEFGGLQFKDTNSNLYRTFGIKDGLVVWGNAEQVFVKISDAYEAYTHEVEILNRDFGEPWNEAEKGTMKFSDWNAGRIGYEVGIRQSASDHWVVWLYQNYKN